MLLSLLVHIAHNQASKQVEASENACTPALMHCLALLQCCTSAFAGHIDTVVSKREDYLYSPTRTIGYLTSVDNNLRSGETGPRIVV